ncbi:MAG: hypothetical protein GWN61_26655, partial [candidate division Zixibacteria bacterium]|nr:hypothetical protein [candidate division Zixibacteria bacterium]NIV09653.1 hypothetical protein [candidate division Zixibacteria bacterium]NIW50590.1 hypothetical protein [Gammaproteobacteria bacterium]
TVLGDNFSFDMPTFNIMNSNPDQPENVAVVSSDAILNLGNKQVPPPINLREAEDGFICDQHIDIANGCQ